MSNLSRLCRLSQHYTNHSIRATGVTIMSKCRFGPAQIMAVVNGSPQVGFIIVCVDTEEKISMGQSMLENIVPVHLRGNHLPAPRQPLRDITVTASNSTSTSNKAVLPSSADWQY